MARQKKTISFEDALEQLETLVNEMEQGDMSLEESLKSFETGIKLTRDCQARLASAEQRVRILTEEKDGTLSSQPCVNESGNFDDV